MAAILEPPFLQLLVRLSASPAETITNPVFVSVARYEKRPSLPPSTVLAAPS